MRLVVLTSQYELSAIFLILFVIIAVIGEMNAIGAKVTEVDFKESFEEEELDSFYHYNWVRNVTKDNKFDVPVASTDDYDFYQEYDEALEYDYKEE